MNTINIEAVEFAASAPDAVAATKRKDLLLDAQVLSNESVELKFTDEYVCHTSAESLGMDPKRFDLSTAQLVSGGIGIEVRRRSGTETAMFDAESLRCRVDSAYAKTVRDAIDLLYIPKDANFPKSEKPTAWYGDL